MFKRILLALAIAAVMICLFWFPVQNPQWQRVPIEDYLFQPNQTGFSLFRNQERQTFNFLSPYNDTYTDTNGKKEAYIPVVNKNDVDYSFTTSQSPLRSDSWLKIIDNWLEISSPWAKLKTPYWEVDYTTDLQPSSTIAGAATLTISKEHHLRDDSSMPKKISSTLVFTPRTYIFDPISMTSIKNQETEPSRFDFFQRSSGQELNSSAQQGINVVVDYTASNSACIALKNPEDAQFLAIEVEPGQEIVLDENYHLLEIFTPVPPTITSDQPINNDLKVNIFRNLVDLQTFCLKRVKGVNAS